METERVLELLRLVTAELITVRTGSEQRLNANKTSPHLSILPYPRGDRQWLEGLIQVADYQRATGGSRKHDWTRPAEYLNVV